MEIGQLVVKTCGRDSGNFGIVIEKVDETYVLVDGNIRRKKCNIKHLEMIDKIVKIKEKASSEEVKKALEKEGIKILKKGEKRTAKKKPVKSKKSSKKKPSKETKEKKPKKEEKKPSPKKEDKK